MASQTRPARDKVRDTSKEAGHAVANAARNVGKDVKEGAVKVKDAFSDKSTPAPKE